MAGKPRQGKAYTPGHIYSGHTSQDPGPCPSTEEGPAPWSLASQPPSLLHHESGVSCPPHKGAQLQPLEGHTAGTPSHSVQTLQVTCVQGTTESAACFASSKSVSFLPLGNLGLCSTPEQDLRGTPPQRFPCPSLGTRSPVAPTQSADQSISLPPTSCSLTQMPRTGQWWGACVLQYGTLRQTSTEPGPKWVGLGRRPPYRRWYASLPGHA